MASLHEYKRLENKIVQKIKKTVLKSFSFIAGVFMAIGRFLTRRYTLVFVPHSEKKVYNLHVTVLSILCFLLVIFSIIGAFFWYGASYNSTMSTMATRDGLLRDTQASLDLLRDETSLLLREARSFENALSSVLSVLGINNRNSASQNISGDLSSFLGISETPAFNSPEVNELRMLSRFMSQSVEPILELGSLINSQSVLLTEIPSIWPVRGGAGQITMFFGQNVHPIFGHFYIHRGIDIATHRSGDPVVATADGQVVTAEYDTGYGYFIIIRHRHGYYTRYAHLSSFRVNVGQRVQQGEVIGYIGSTGISTGPHLHYEVHVGSDVVDPFRYVTIRSSLSRQGR
ncbi:MAG: M23 family metallopeptidase [Treponema sp.]|jgi:murein DD-endopeptidase MepM/ murein hydrolase activator NlpD|nr:M23 family metallopeptidase [Treponema sp.]